MKWPRLAPYGLKPVDPEAVDRELRDQLSGNRDAFMRALTVETDAITAQLLRSGISTGWGDTSPAWAPIRPPPWRRFIRWTYRARYALARPLQWLADRVRGYELRGDY